MGSAGCDDLVRKQGGEGAEAGGRADAGQEASHRGDSPEEVRSRLPAQGLLQVFHLDERLMRPSFPLRICSHHIPGIAPSISRCTYGIPLKYTLEMGYK